MLERRDHGRVRVLLLNRPPSNTLSLALLESLVQETAAADQDPSVRCLVLASALPKYFSSGLDLEEILSLPEPQRARMYDRIMGAHRAVAGVGKPTVAALGGACLLGGYVLALACDWRWLASGAGKVSLSEIRLGLSPTTPLISLVSGLCGRPGLVKELILQGKTLRSAEAFEAGLVDGLFPDDGFFESVLHEAEKLSKMPSSAYASVKRSLRKALLPCEKSIWEEGAREFDELFSGAEAQEGVSAMKEKRRPRWE